VGEFQVAAGGRRGDYPFRLRIRAIIATDEQKNDTAAPSVYFSEKVMFFIAAAQGCVHKKYTKRCYHQVVNAEKLFLRCCN
jgi:hypothetical protein